MPSNKSTAVPVAGVESATISGIYSDAIRLEQGRYQGEPFAPGGVSRPTVTLLAEPRTSADVDGDGSPEWVVVLTESSGGSGTFYYLAVLQQNGPGYRSVSTVFLGDRVRVEQLSFDGRTVRLDLLVSGKDDPACCPTELRTHRWRWFENDLKAVVRLGGKLVYGHEAREFVACDGGRFWVTDATDDDLRQTYEATIATPYQPLFAEIDAIRLPAPDAAFAEPYDEQLRVMDLRRLESEGHGCDLDMGEARIRASGVEPFWHIDVEANSLRFSRLGQAPRVYAMSAQETVASGRTLRGESDGESVTLTLSEQRCTNPMSGSVFAYTAKLSLPGEELSGCALTPLPTGAE